MVKIECSRCAVWIHLPFHGKEDRIECPHCAETTPVRDIFVSGGPFIMHRDILVKNMQKYRRLVCGVEKDLLELQKKGASSRAHEISARSLSLFVSDLKEMLDGCRDIVRHGMNGVKALITVDGRRYYGNILNLSVSGICLEAGRTASVNRLWNGVKVLLKGEKTGPFTVEGKIMWIGKNGQMGIRFSNVDEPLRSLIKGYILEKTRKHA
jgi:hypothetical protein